MKYTKMLDRCKPPISDLDGDISDPDGEGCAVSVVAMILLAVLVGASLAWIVR